MIDFTSVEAAAESIRRQPNIAPTSDCGHSVYSLAKISDVGVVCLECPDTEWEQISDPLDGPVGLFRRKAQQ